MLAAYRLAALRATEDVENSLSAFSRRQEQVLVLKAGVDSLGRARAASFSAYQKGVVSLIEVLHADETLLRAADARVQALSTRRAFKYGTLQRPFIGQCLGCVAGALCFIGPDRRFRQKALLAVGGTAVVQA